MIRKNSFVFLVIFFIGALLVGCSSQSTNKSQSGSTTTSKSKFPERAIEIIVPFSAGGGSDLTARTFALYLEKELGVPVAIINKPGGGSVVGTQATAKAKPDGYTLGLTGLPGLPATAITGVLTIDPVKDFEYLGSIVSDPAVIAVSTKSKFQSLNELIDFLKENPEKLSYGASGTNGLDAITAYAFDDSLGAKFRLVSFESGSEAITGVLGGHIDVVGLAASEAKTYIESGDLKVLGVAGDQRIASMPDVPTFSEEGYEFSEGFDLATKNGVVRGFVMPAGADEEVLSVLREAVKKAAENPEFKAQAEKVGLPVSYQDGDTFAESVKIMIEELKIPKN